MAIRIKRIYEPADKADGYRILVDRLWPRGIKKEEAHIDRWLKEVAPSTELRLWYHHDVDKWKQFCSKYKAELKDSEALKELKALVREHKDVTFLYASKNETHNQALALKEFVL